MAKSHLVEEFGDGTGKYSDGATRWLTGNDKGKHAGALVKAHPKQMKPFTSETARDASHRRQELRREAAEQGAIEAIKDGLAINVSGPAEAAKYLYKAQADIALSPEMGRSSTEAFKVVMSGMDMYADRRQQNEAPIINIKIDNATLQAVRDVDAYDDDDVIDVKAEDVPF
jgi:hypothetical protein